MSKTTGLRTEVSNDWRLDGGKSFNDLDKSKMVNCLLSLAAFITGKYCYDRSLLLPARFCTGQETCATGRSQTSVVGWDTLHWKRPGPLQLHQLPPANAEKCPIPFSIHEIFRCGVKVSWLGIFCILRGVFFFFLPKSRPESIIFFLSEQRAAFLAEVRAPLSSRLSRREVSGGNEKKTPSSNTQKCKRVKWKFK